MSDVTSETEALRRQIGTCAECGKAPATNTEGFCEPCKTILLQREGLRRLTQMVEELRAENALLLKDASVWRNEAINRRDDRSQAFLDAAKMAEALGPHLQATYDKRKGVTVEHAVCKIVDLLHRAAEGVKA